MKHKSKFFLLYTVILMVLSTYIEAAIRKEVYTGYAKSDRGELLYEERHDVTFDDNRILRSVTKYHRPDGKHFATMDSDYSRSVKMPTYSFKDDSREYEEGLYFENDKYVVYFKDKGKPKQSKILEDDGAYSCQGWHYFLVNNLAEIEKGTLSLRLVLPGKLESFKFELVKLDSTDKLLKVKLHVSNWFLQMFAPSLKLVYDKVSKRLIQYNGVSNILKGDGGTQDVEITYSYED